MKRNRIALLALFIVLVFFTLPALAQDTTPTPESEMTAVVVVPPVVDVPVEVTEVATDTPPVIVVNNPPATENGFSDGVLKLLGVVVVLVVGSLVVVIIDQNRTVRAGVVQLGASTPAFVYEAGKSGVQTGIGSLETLAKSTDFTTLDDEAVADLKRRVLGWVAEMDAKRTSVSVNSSEHFPVG